MGQAKLKTQRIKDANLPCIFCGGVRIATTEDHCPPKAVFRGKHAPFGYTFPACKICNEGTSDDDLVIAFLAKVADDDATGLMKLVNRQHPGFLSRMLDVTANQARSWTRRLGLKRSEGQTYQETGVVNVTDEMHKAVQTLGLKFSKAIYYKYTNLIFPVDGGVLFQWFTNAQKYEYGCIAILEALSHINKQTEQLVRNSKVLNDQFDFAYSVSDDGTLHLIQATFRNSFGFVTIFSQTAGYLENMEREIKSNLNTEKFPFKFISNNSDCLIATD